MFQNLRMILCSLMVCLLPEGVVLSPQLLAVSRPYEIKQVTTISGAKDFLSAQTLASLVLCPENLSSSLRLISVLNAQAHNISSFSSHSLTLFPEEVFRMADNFQSLSARIPFTQ